VGLDCSVVSIGDSHWDVSERGSMGGSGGMWVRDFWVEWGDKLCFDLNNGVRVGVSSVGERRRFCSVRGGSQSSVGGVYGGLRSGMKD